MKQKNYEPVTISLHVFDCVDIVRTSGFDTPIKIDDDYIFGDIY